jgi:hypothetical protein
MIDTSPLLTVATAGLSLVHVMLLSMAFSGATVAVSFTAASPSFLVSDVSLSVILVTVEGLSTDPRISSRVFSPHDVTTTAEPQIRVDTSSHMAMLRVDFVRFILFGFYLL